MYERIDQEGFYKHISEDVSISEEEEKVRMA